MWEGRDRSKVSIHVAFIPAGVSAWADECGWQPRPLAMLKPAPPWPHAAPPLALRIPLRIPLRISYASLYAPLYLRVPALCATSRLRLGQLNCMQSAS